MYPVGTGAADHNLSGTSRATRAARTTRAACSGTARTACSGTARSTRSAAASASSAASARASATAAGTGADTTRSNNAAGTAGTTAARDSRTAAALTLIVASATVQNKAGCKDAAYEIGGLTHRTHHWNDTSLDKPIEKNVSSPSSEAVFSGCMPDRERPKT
jgi:hypothetical protein